MHLWLFVICTCIMYTNKYSCNVDGLNKSCTYTPICFEYRTMMLNLWHAMLDSLVTVLYPSFLGPWQTKLFWPMDQNCSSDAMPICINGRNHQWLTEGGPQSNCNYFEIVVSPAMDLIDSDAKAVTASGPLYLGEANSMTGCYGYKLRSICLDPGGPINTHV